MVQRKQKILTMFMFAILFVNLAYYANFMNRVPAVPRLKNTSRNSADFSNISVMRLRGPFFGAIWRRNKEEAKTATSVTDIENYIRLDIMTDLYYIEGKQNMYDDKNCPKLQPGLGPVTVDEQETELEVVERKYPEVHWGGRYTPTNCTVTHKVAIIVPYRNRKQHLAIFLNHMHPFLMRQHIEYGIFIIEQEGGLSFNRGKLLNVGYVESDKRKAGGWQCFIFHDIDLLPLDLRNMYTCPRQPRHMSASIDTLQNTLPYEEIFGGVSAMTKDQFRAVNGFHNNYWGWGGEDDDMSNRITKRGFHLSRYKMSIARYNMLSHKKLLPNPFRFETLHEAYKSTNTVFSEGLTTLRYKVVRVTYNHLFTHVLVNIDDKEYMNKHWPMFVLNFPFNHAYQRLRWLKGKFSNLRYLIFDKFNKIMASWSKVEPTKSFVKTTRNGVFCPTSHRYLGPTKWKALAMPIVLDRVFSMLKTGGSYRPDDCLPTETVAVIVPYRGKDAALLLFLFTIHLFLSTQLAEYQIFIIKEFNETVPLNPGKLFNIGFIEAHKIRKDVKWTCIVFHDPYLAPKDSRNLYRCSEKPQQLVAVVDDVRYEYELGGAIAIKPEDFREVNGFSNLYLDSESVYLDMYDRLMAANLTIAKPSLFGTYDSLRTGNEPSNPTILSSTSEATTGNMLTSTVEWQDDGLTSLSYARSTPDRRLTHTLIEVDTARQQSHSLSSPLEIRTSTFGNQKYFFKTRALRKNKISVT